MALRVTIPLGRGEAPTSFASRLAAANGLPVREFCLDWDFRFQSVVDGDVAAIEVLADKGGVAAADLMAHAFIRGQNHAFTYRGEQLMRLSLRRQRVAICPRCLAEDMANSQVAPRLAPFGRAIWQIAAVKTCPVHQTPLVVVAEDLTPGTLHDWAYHVSKAVPDLPRLVAEATARPLTGLEAYVVARLDALGGQHRLLDRLLLHVAIGACELFGAAATLGRTPDLKRLTDEQWRAAGAAGFEILAAGEPAVAEFLEGLQKSYPYSGAATEGAQAIFGRIYQVLEFGREDASYDKVRDLVGDYIRTRFPVGPSDVVFGKPVERRVLHSVRTLSLETKLHPKRLKKLLRASGLLSADADGLAGGNCLFDAEQGSRAAKEAAAATLSVQKTGLYLNAPRVQRDMLYRAGLIVPRVSGSDHGAADQFSPADLDAFLDRLLDGAAPVKSASDARVSIPDAARLACCTSEEIVRLILDGRLSRKWRLTSERGYLSVLVDVEEVRALVRGPDHGGLTGLEIKDRLSTTAKVAAALIKHGHLKTLTVINPVNRCPTVVVPIEEVERFAREYISLFALAKQQGRHFLAVKQELEDDGIEPALDPKKIGASFYRRSEC
jgi:TniQ